MELGEEVKKDFGVLEELRKKIQEEVDDNFKRSILNDIITHMNHQGVASWKDLDPITRSALRHLNLVKDVLTTSDVYYLLDVIKGSVSSASTGDLHNPPYVDSSQMGTPGTSGNSAGTPRKSGNFESSQKFPPYLQKEAKFPEFDIHTLLTAIKQVLYRAYNEAGKSTKRAEYRALQLSLAYLLSTKEATLDEIVVGIKGLAREHDIAFKYNIKELSKALRNTPGVLHDSVGQETFRLSDKLRQRIIEQYHILKQVEESAQKYSASSDLEDRIRVFLNFFRDYVDGSGSHKYMGEITKLLVEKKDKSLTVDWFELNSMSPDLASAVMEDPEGAILAAESAVDMILKEDFFEENPPKIHVRFVNLPETLSPKHIQSKHLGRLIQIKGIITAVAEGQRTDGRSGFIEKAVFVCRDCGNEMIRLQRPYENFIIPQKCDACGSRNFELDIEKSRVIDKREIFVQDSEDAMRATTMPSYIRVILLDDLARMRLEPGDEVLMTIILRGVRKSQKDNSLAWVGEAVSVMKLTKDAEDIEITPQDEQKFREMAKDPDFEEKFIESIAPTVVGQDARRLKKALAWALFSGDDEVVENMHIRNRIHVLAYGPPSTAKTTITKYATELAPRHYWVSAPTTSGAGLTAALDSMDGKRVLKAGALVIASGGVAGVNELDKMRDEEYDRLLDAMEEGQFTYNKAGFTTTLTAMTRLFATANPPGGKFDTHKVPMEELRQQFPRPLISRFDVIVVVREAKDLREREAIADAIFRRRKKEVNPIYPPELMTKYIAFAHRNIREVDIPEEVWKVAKEYLLKITKNAPTAMPRMIEAFLRLMVARARMHLRDRVTIQDFIAVKEFYTEMLQLLLGTDSEEMMSELLAKFGGITWTEKEKELVDKLYNIIRYFEELSEEGAFLNDIIEEARQVGIDKGDVLRLIEEMVQEKLIYSPKPGWYMTKSG